MIGKCKRLGPYSTWFYLSRFQWRWAEPITALCRSRDQSDRSNGVAQGNCIMVVWQVAGWQEEGWVVGSHHHHDQNYHVRGLSIKLAGWRKDENVLCWAFLSLCAAGKIREGVPAPQNIRILHRFIDDLHHSHSWSSIGRHLVKFEHLPFDGIWLRRHLVKTAFG